MSFSYDTSIENDNIVDNYIMADRGEACEE